ncbi:MAG: OmpA family protein [Deltaproteobacteria bacterium]|nr:OmpA family protein [Deltaproteobacteria bacterium]
MIRQAPKSPHHVFAVYAAFVLTFSAACSTPLTTREKGAGIGALGGAAAGGIIGSAVGHPGAGAAIGGTLGLGAGALIGDQLQGQEQRQQEQQQRIEQQKTEITKNRALLEELRRHNIEARETDRGVSVNLPNVLFQFNSAELTPDGRDRVKQMSSIVKDKAQGRKISVEGHASRERADQEAHNQELSERRARAVAGGLENNGVERNRIVARGLGTRFPVASNETEEGRRKNRRVEVTIEN